VLGLEPYSGNGPPIWVGGTGPRMLELAGRYGDGWLPWTMSATEYGDKLRAILRIAERHGRDPSRFTAGIFAEAVIDEDHEECHRLLDTVAVKTFRLTYSSEVYARYGVDHPLGKGADGLRDFVSSRISREEALELVRRVPFDLVHDSILHGTPSELAAQVAAYQEQGLQHLGLWNLTFMSDTGKLRPSYEAMTELVRLIRANESTQ